MVSVERISEDNQNVLKDLSWAIEADRGQFSLKLAHCNYSNLREQIIEQLQNISTVPIQLIKLEPTDTTLYTKIQDQIEIAGKPVALMVTGLESVKDLEELLRATNQVREEFRKNLPFPLILWINDRVLQKLQEVAQDFVNWSPASFRFTVTDADVLAQEIGHKADLIFERILKLGSKRFLSNQDILGANYHEELQAAQQDLASLESELSPESQANLNFIEGREDYIKDDFLAAIEKYQASLSFWNSQNEKGLKAAMILFNIGLSYQKLALNIDYDSHKIWQDARQAFEQSLAIFEQLQRQDLVAKFINCLGEVFINLSAWNDLQQLAEKSIRLQKEYQEPSCLAQAYGFLGEFYLEQGQCEDAINAASSAIEALKSLSDADTSSHHLLSAIALSKLGKHEQAVTAHQQASKFKTHNQPLAYLRLLEKLRLSYWSNKYYVEAYRIKQEQINLKREIGLTAFVGAVRLKQFASAQAFGRQFDIDELITRIGTDANKLTILYGQSGVGKSSLVEAGLLPSLQRKGRIGKRDLITLNLRVYSNWEQELANCLTDELAVAETKLNKKINIFNTIYSTADILKQLEHNSDNYLLTILIFDQFEEFFFEYKTKAEQKLFWKFLAKCLEIRFVKVILSLREDYIYFLLHASDLVDLSSISNNILDKGNLHNISNFPVNKTQAIIESLTKKSQFKLESDLVKQLVTDLAADLEDEVRPIELQIIGAQLQTLDIRNCDKYLALEEPRKENLVKQYFESVIKDCGKENQQVAEIVLYLLTNENNTRPFKTKFELTQELKTLASELEVKEEALTLILNIFVLSGLVTKFAEETARYQLVHDYLVEPIRRQYDYIPKQLEAAKQNQEQAEAARIKLLKRSLFGLVLGVLLLFGVSVLAVINARQANKFALEEKNQAKIQLARQLAAKSEWIRSQRADLHEPSILVGLESLKILQELNASSLEVDSALRNGLELLPNYFGVITDNTYSKKVLFSPNGEYLAIASGNLVRLIKVSSGAEIVRITHEADVWQVAFSPNGKYLATAGEGKTTRLIQVRNGAEIIRITHKAVVPHVAFSPDGDYLATASLDGMARLIQVSSGKEITRIDHIFPVDRVVFSRNGEYLATASWDNTARLIQVSSGKEIVRITYEADVDQIAFSPNGEYLATASLYRITRLIKLISGEEIARITYEADVNQVAFIRNGDYLAIASDDNTARLIQVSSGEEIARITYEADVNQVAFSPDGDYLAIASDDNTARLIQVSSGEEVARITHEADVNQVAFSPNGYYLATVSEDDTVRLIQVNKNKVNPQITHKARIWQVAFSLNGDYLATASSDNTASLIKLSSGEEINRITHEAYVRQVVFSPDGDYLATRSSDNTARLIQVSSGEEIARINHTANVRQIALSPNGKYLATASDDQTTRLIQVSSGEEVARITHKDIVFHVTFSPNGKYLATASRDGTARIIQLSSGAEIARFPHEDWVIQIAFSPNSEYLATRSSDNTARLIKLGSGEEIARITHDDNLYQLVFSPNGDYLATRSSDKTARLIQVSSGAEIARITHEDIVYHLAFSPNSEYLATASYDKTARLIKVNTGEEIAPINHEDRVIQVEFSSNGDYLATASYDNTARLIKVNTGEEVARITHEDTVYHLAFSPNGDYLASASDDKTARLIKVNTGEEVARIIHEDTVYHVAFSPNGDYLATVSEDNTVRLNLIDTEKLINKICQSLIHNLSIDYWEQYMDNEPYRKTCDNLPLHPDVLPSFLQEGRRLALEGKIKEAISSFKESQKLDPDLKIEAQSWNTLCRFGAIYGNVNKVLFACEEAVKLADNPRSKIQYLDSRGLARALTGDIQGAIEDFQVYADYDEFPEELKYQQEQRRQWIEALQKGENPFTEEVLEELKTQ